MLPPTESLLNKVFLFCFEGWVREKQKTAGNFFFVYVRARSTLDDVESSPFSSLKGKF